MADVVTHQVVVENDLIVGGIFAYASYLVCGCGWRFGPIDGLTTAELWRLDQRHAADVAADSPRSVVAGTLMAKAPEPRRRCPDDGVCHHGCTFGCFRVGACGPLSGVYEDDEWPDDVINAFTMNDGRY